jgi:hypothetical protein
MSKSNGGNAAVGKAGGSGASSGSASAAAAAAAHATQTAASLVSKHLRDLQNAGGSVQSSQLRGLLQEDPSLLFDAGNFGQLSTESLFHLTAVRTTAAGFRNAIMEDLGRGVWRGGVQGRFVGTLQYIDGRMVWQERPLVHALSQLPVATRLHPLSEAACAAAWVNVDEPLLFGAAVAEWVNTVQKGTLQAYEVNVPCFVFHSSYNDVVMNCDGCAARDVVPSLKPVLKSLPALVFTTCGGNGPGFTSWPKETPAATSTSGAVPHLLNQALAQGHGIRASHHFHPTSVAAAKAQATSRPVAATKPMSVEALRSAVGRDIAMTRLNVLTA